MNSLQVRWLVLTAVVPLVLGGVLSALVERPGYLLVLAWGPLVLVLAVAVVELVLARRVRAFVQEPRKKPINPLLAARIAVFAQTVAVFGAMLLGWSLGVMLHELRLLQVRSLTSGTVLIAANVVLGVLALVAGLVAESWCRRPPEDDEDGDAQYPGSTWQKADAAQGEGGYARTRGEQERRS